MAVERGREPFVAGPANAPILGRKPGSAMEVTPGRTRRMLRLHTFGGLSVEGPDGPVGGAGSQRKALALLALLSPGGPKGMSRERLGAYLWAESPEDKVSHRLTQLIYSSASRPSGRGCVSRHRGTAAKPPGHRH